MIELLRNSKDKRARKLAKKRVSLVFPSICDDTSSVSYLELLLAKSLLTLMACLQLGTFGRAKRKVDELQGVIAESRRAGH